MNRRQENAHARGGLRPDAELHISKRHQQSAMADVGRIAVLVADPESEMGSPLFILHQQGSAEFDKAHGARELHKAFRYVFCHFHSLQKGTRGAETGPPPLRKGIS